MDKLLEIKNLIDKMSNNPQDIDIDSVKTVLSFAYEVSRDGLKRSQSNTDYENLKTLFDSKSEELVKIKEQYNALSNQHSDFKVLVPFFEDLKTKLIGKVNLISNYDNSYKESLINDIKSVNPENVVSIFNRVENDFNKDWNKETKNKTILKQDINLKNYKIGG